MILRTLSVIILLVIFTKYSYSQNNNHDSISSIVIEEVNVNAPILINSKQVWPGGYFEVDSINLQSGNGYELSERLNAIPGVFMQQGTLSTNRITIRGIGSRTPYNSNRIKAYWGDIPITDGDGVTALEDFGLNDISRIQVLKGPASALYGSGLGGVILLSPNKVSSIDNGIFLKSEAGSFATFLQQACFNILNNKRVDLNLNMNHLTSDGYRQNSNYKRTNLTLGGSTKIGGSLFNLLYNYRFLNGQIPSSLDSADFYNNPQRAANSWASIRGYEKSHKHIISIGWNVPINTQLANSFSVFSHISSLNELRPFNQLKETKHSIGAREKFVYKNGANKVNIGFEFMIEGNHLSYFSVDDINYNELLSSNKLNRSHINIFGLYEKLFFKKLLLQASINVNRTHYESVLDDAGFNYNWIASPRLALNYSLTNEQNIFLSAGHGFSTPSFEEALLYDGSFNRQIEPEEGWGYEIGYRFSGFDQRLFIDITLYALRMQNLLVTKRESEEVFYGINAGKTMHNGIESSLMYYVLPETDRRFIFINANYFSSKNEFRSFIDDGLNQKGNQLPGIPEYMLSLDLNMFFRPVTFDVSYKQVGIQYLTDDNSKSYSAYQKMDLKAKVDIEFLKVKGSVYVGCNNVFDEHYASMLLINASSFGSSKPRYYYPAQPVNFYGGVEFCW